GSLTVAGISRLKIKGQTELIGPTDLPQVDPDRVMAFAGPFTFVDAAQPVIYAGGWVEGFGEVVTGRLTVRGSVRPGNLNYGGRLTVRGNYTQTNTSSLDLELGKPGGPDQLVVAGASAPIYLDGMLNLNFNGFTPTFGTPLLLLDNQSNQPIVGYYVNYAPNQVFSVNGYHTGSKK
ncbi:MAG: hypothetical protein K2X82_10375, partial [Gemmataceae bacterium]|nr:hypothetical protein [Gemmataceae bacterium]